MSKKNIIHIHAKCDAFEIFEVVPEKRAVGRLVKIRNMAAYAGRRKSVGTLVVKTRVVNPELSFT